DDIFDSVYQQPSPFADDNDPPDMSTADNIPASFANTPPIQRRTYDPQPDNDPQFEPLNMDGMQVPRINNRNLFNTLANDLNNTTSTDRGPVQRDYEPTADAYDSYDDGYDDMPADDAPQQPDRNLFQALADMGGFGFGGNNGGDNIQRDYDEDMAAEDAPPQRRNLFDALADMGGFGFGKRDSADASNADNIQRDYDDEPAGEPESQGQNLFDALSSMGAFGFSGDANADNIQRDYDDSDMDQVSDLAIFQELARMQRERQQGPPTDGGNSIQRTPDGNPPPITPTDIERAMFRARKSSQESDGSTSQKPKFNSVQDLQRAMLQQPAPPDESVQRKDAAPGNLPKFPNQQGTAYGHGRIQREEEVDIPLPTDTPAVDIDGLARDVYEIIRNRLRMERERRDRR
ncbi:MAG: hypothetical protein AAFR56_06015, partial [Chloroflexota bacterium]